MSGSEKEIKAVPSEKHTANGSQSGNETAAHIKRALDAARDSKKQAENKKK